MVRFLELKGLEITDYQRESKFHIIVTHDSGTREEFETVKKARAVAVTCHTFLPLPPTRATMQILRKDKPKRKNAVPAIALTSIYRPDDNYDTEIDLPAEYGLRITLDFGHVVTATEVANARLQAALRSLDSKREMMEVLEIGTKQLSLLSQVGEAVAELNSAAKAIAKITSIILDRVADIPASHGKLIRLASQLVDQLESSTLANKTFNSEHVRKALDKLIDLIVQVAQEIEHCYSRPKWVVFMNELASPRREAIVELEKELEQHKMAISQAFLVEMRSGITDVQDDVNTVKEGVSTVRVEVASVQKELRTLRHNDDEDKNKQLLDKLLPPADSRFYGKVTCLEGTRKSVLDAIDNWVRDTSVPAEAASPGTPRVLSRLFWLHGVAGCGKSTIAASICQRLASRLAGSFFCKRDQDERRNGVRLLWAIAFYLAQANAAYKERLLIPLREADALLDLDLDTQFNRLIIQPLKAVSNNGTSTSALIAIDALDECNDAEAVARSLAQILEITPWTRFIVTSRDLPGVRDALTPLGDLQEVHDLFQYDAREDISAYLRAQFMPRGPLAELHQYINEDEVATLVDRSQGLFIWIHTVIRFIGDTRIGKLDVLESVLRLERAVESESALDSIYRIVLENAAGSSTTSRNIVRLIVGLILVTSANDPLPPGSLHAFLPADVSALRSEFDTILQLLSPVLIIHSNGVRVYHTSFLDFSSHETRCGEAFYTSQCDLDAIMATGCLEIMEFGTRRRKRLRKTEKVERSGLKFNICNLRSSFLTNAEVPDLEERRSACISSELLYSSIFWFEHYRRSGMVQSTSEDRGTVELAKNLLCTERALHWLEVLSISDKLASARSILTQISESGAPLGSAVVDIAVELRRFLDQFYSCIALSTPHLYLSTIPWLSTTMKISAAWQATFSPGQIPRVPVQRSPLMLHHVTCPCNVWSVSVSRDGSLFAACGEDGVVRMFDMHTGRIVWEHLSTFGHKLGTIRAVSFSPTADILVSSHAGGTGFCVWSTLSHDRTLKHVVNNGSGVYHLDFSKNGSQLATGSVDGLLRVWDVSSWTLKQGPMAGHTSTITFVAFSPDGTRIATASGDRTVRLWNIETGTPIGSSMVGHDEVVWTVAFSPDGTTLASGSADMRVILWDTRTGNMIERPLQGHRWWVRSVVFTHDGQFLLSGSGDMNIRMWDARTGASFGAPLKERILGFAPSFVLSPDGTRGVIASGAQDVTIWDIPATVSKAVPPGHSHHVFTVAFSPDDTMIASGGWDNCVYLWTREGRCVNRSPMQHPTIVFFVRFSPDGKLLASGDQNGLTRIWDVMTGAVICEFKSHAWVNSAAWSPDGTKLVVAVERGPPSLRFWDARTGQPLGEPFEGVTHSVKMIVYSPDGSTLAGVCTDSTVQLWDAETGAQIAPPFTGHTNFAESIAFSPDGSKLVTGGWDSTLRVWDTATGQQLFDPVVHNGAVLSVAFSTDGKLVYSAGWDWRIHAWDTQTGRPMGCPLKGHTQPINSITISHDGRYIASGGRDDAVRLWDIQAFFWEKVPSSFNLNRDLRGPERVPEDIADDGWIRTAKGELILWVPTQYRGPLCDMSSLCVSQDPENHPVRIQWDNICGGESWEKVRSA